MTFCESTKIAGSHKLLGLFSERLDKKELNIFVHLFFYMFIVFPCKQRVVIFITLTIDSIFPVFFYTRVSLLSGIILPNFEVRMGNRWRLF